MRTLDPRLNLVLPFVERIGARRKMMEQVLDIPSQQAITHDNAVVTVDAIVFVQLLDAAQASCELRDLLSAILNRAIMNI